MELLTLQEALERDIEYDTSAGIDDEYRILIMDRLGVLFGPRAGEVIASIPEANYKPRAAEIMVALVDAGVPDSYWMEQARIRQRDGIPWAPDLTHFELSTIRNRVSNPILPVYYGNTYDGEKLRRVLPPTLTIQPAKKKGGTKNVKRKRRKSKRKKNYS